MMRTWILALLVALAAAPAAAADFFPLETGMRWEFTEPAGSTRTVTVIGPVVFGGQECVEVELEYIGLWPQVTYQYYRRDQNDDVYFHGYRNDQGPVVFSPPVLWIDVPLTPDKTWTTVTDAGGQTLVFGRKVAWQGMVYVPLGAYWCIGIANDVNGEWWISQFLTPGVGEVEVGMWELVDFSGPTATLPLSWSTLKAEFE